MRKRSGTVIPEAERSKRGQARVRLTAEAVAVVDEARLDGESRGTAASRLLSSFGKGRNRSHANSTEH
jgi:hypothetical protein